MGRHEKLEIADLRIRIAEYFKKMWKVFNIFTIYCTKPNNLLHLGYQKAKPSGNSVHICKLMPNSF